MPTPRHLPHPPPWSIGSFEISGLLDGYYSMNFNHPASQFNTLRNFEVRANSFALNMTKLSVTHAPDPIGVTLDLGWGRAWKIFHATDPAGTDVVQYIPQAFVSVKPPNWGGFQFDFGKFYTSAGAELTENNLTWSYGRGYLYTNGPYYHFGARVTKPVAIEFHSRVPTGQRLEQCGGQQQREDHGLHDCLDREESVLVQHLLCRSGKNVDQ